MWWVRACARPRATLHVDVHTFPLSPPPRRATPHHTAPHRSAVAHTLLRFGWYSHIAPPLLLVGTHTVLVVCKWCSALTRYAQLGTRQSHSFQVLPRGSRGSRTLVPGRLRQSVHSARGIVQQAQCIMPPQLAACSTRHTTVRLRLRRAAGIMDSGRVPSFSSESFLLPFG
jgi:hypothetical protein